MKNYKIVLFDFDGTLVNSFRSLIGVYQDAFATIGQTVSPEEAAIYMHESLVDTCKGRGLGQEETMKVIMAAQEAVDSPKHLKELELYDETKNVIESLYSQGKQLSIVSGNSPKHIRLALKQFGMEKYFSFVVGASASSRPKPFPDPILEVLKSYESYSPSEVVYIGDSLQDSQCAKNARVDGILLERNHEYPTYEGTKISSLSDLLK